MPPSIQPSAIDDGFEFELQITQAQPSHEVDLQEWVEPGDDRSAIDDRAATERNFNNGQDVHASRLAPVVNATHSLRAASALRIQNVQLSVAPTVATPVQAEVTSAGAPSPSPKMAENKPKKSYKGIIIRSKDGETVIKPNPWVMRAEVPAPSAPPSAAPSAIAAEQSSVHKKPSLEFRKQKIKVVGKDGQVAYHRIFFPLEFEHVTKPASTAGSPASLPSLKRDHPSYAPSAAVKTTSSVDGTASSRPPISQKSSSRGSQPSSTSTPKSQHSLETSKKATSTAAIPPSQPQSLVDKPSSSATHGKLSGIWEREVTPNDSASVLMTGALPAPQALKTASIAKSDGKASDRTARSNHDSAIGLGGSSVVKSSSSSSQKASSSHASSVRASQTSDARVSTQASSAPTSKSSSHRSDDRDDSRSKKSSASHAPSNRTFHAPGSRVSIQASAPVSEASSHASDDRADSPSKKSTASHAPSKRTSHAPGSPGSGVSTQASSAPVSKASSGVSSEAHHNSARKSVPSHASSLRASHAPDSRKSSQVSTIATSKVFSRESIGATKGSSRTPRPSHTSSRRTPHIPDTGSITKPPSVTTSKHSSRLSDNEFHHSDLESSESNSSNSFSQRTSQTAPAVLPAYVLANPTHYTIYPFTEQPPHVSPTNSHRSSAKKPSTSISRATEISSYRPASVESVLSGAVREDAKLLPESTVTHASTSTRSGRPEVVLHPQAVFQAAPRWTFPGVPEIPAAPEGWDGGGHNTAISDRTRTVKATQSTSRRSRGHAPPLLVVPSVTPSATQSSMDSERTGSVSKKSIHSRSSARLEEEKMARAASWSSRHPSSSHFSAAEDFEARGSAGAILASTTASVAESDGTSYTERRDNCLVVPSSTPRTRSSVKSLSPGRGDSTHSRSSRPGGDLRAARRAEWSGASSPQNYTAADMRALDSQTHVSSRSGGRSASTWVEEDVPTHSMMQAISSEGRQQQQSNTSSHRAPSRHHDRGVPEISQTSSHTSSSRAVSSVTSSSHSSGPHFALPGQISPHPLSSVDFSFTFPPPPPELPPWQASASAAAASSTTRATSSSLHASRISREPRFVVASSTSRRSSDDGRTSSGGGRSGGSRRGVVERNRQPTVEDAVPTPFPPATERSSYGFPSVSSTSARLSADSGLSGTGRNGGDGGRSDRPTRSRRGEGEEGGDRGVDAEMFRRVLAIREEEYLRGVEEEDEEGYL